MRMTPLMLNGQQADIETFFLDPQTTRSQRCSRSLTDDKPILELLNIPGGNAWRKHIPR